MSAGLARVQNDLGRRLTERGWEAEDGLGAGFARARWYAVWTKSRQEKIATSMIESLGVTSFLPLKTETRRWSDRKQSITVPLFSGYLFVKTDLLDGSKTRVLQVPGVAGLVGNSQGPLPIPDEQIEALRTVVSQGMECTVHPLLEEGDRVRVVRGALAGMQGLLVRMNSSSRFVISVNMIHRSIAVCVDRDDIERMDTRADSKERSTAFTGLNCLISAAGLGGEPLKRSHSA